MTAAPLLSPDVQSSDTEAEPGQLHLPATLEEAHALIRWQQETLEEQATYCVGLEAKAEAQQAALVQAFHDERDALTCFGLAREQRNAAREECARLRAEVERLTRRTPTEEAALAAYDAVVDSLRDEHVRAVRAESERDEARRQRDAARAALQTLTDVAAQRERRHREALRRGWLARLVRWVRGGGR